MTTEDIQSSNTPVVDEDQEALNATSPTSEYYDRERWHDVESDDEATKENSEQIPSSGFSTFSIGILLLIAVIAGGAGIIAAYLIPILFAPQYSIRQKPYYGSTPVLWIGYVENSVFFCEVNEPTCFAAMEDGTLFIGDQNPPSIKVFGTRGQLIRTISLDEIPRAVAVGRKLQEPGEKLTGTLVVALADHLSLLSPEGQPMETWKYPNEQTNVRSIAVAGGHVFAADSKNRIIYRFDETGKADSFGQKPETSAKTNSDKNVSVPETPNVFGGFIVFKAPMTLTVSQKTGLLHIANPGLHRIETFTPDGHWEPSLSWQNNSADVTGFCGCCNPAALDTLRDGRIVTSEQDVVRVKVYRRDGRLDCVVAGPEILRRKPLNVPQLQDLPPLAEIDKTPVFIAALGNDHVMAFDPVWRIVRQFVPTDGVIPDTK